MRLPIPILWFLLPLLGILIYAPCLNGEPVFDDLDVLRTVKNFTWTWTWRARPITTVSYALQGLWPNTLRSLHIGNILIHCACALIVEQIGLAIGMEPVDAALAAIVFTVHPFAVNTVGYITGRASLFSAFFGFAAVLVSMEGPSWMAIPFLVLSVLSKEDGVGYLPVIAVLAHEWRPILALAALAILAAYRYRQRLSLMTRQQGDSMMAMIGLPVSYPLRQNAITVFTETILRLPLWFLSLAMSPYHGSGIAVPRGTRRCLALFLALFAAYIYIRMPLLRIPLICLGIGPWLVYVVCPVPDQLMEYRNYPAIAGFSLLLTIGISHFR